MNEKVEYVLKRCQILSSLSILTSEGLGISNLAYPEERILESWEVSCLIQFKHFLWIEDIDLTSFSGNP